MNIIPYFLCVALGMAIDAGYRHRAKVAERNAYAKGYEKGPKAALRETVQKHETFPAFEESTTHEPHKRKIKKIPESFMEDLHNNGGAVIKL